MPRRIFYFEQPERFVTGTVGQPGSRTFFLQAREGERVVSVVLEKAQVAVLADRLALLLDELGRRGLADTGGAAGQQDVEPLDEPLNEAFRAGTLSITWDGDREEVTIEAREQTEDEDLEAAAQTVEIEDDAEDGPDLVRVRLTAAAARAFAQRAATVVAAGRPPCPFCGQPLDPQGHLCPRRNGGYVN
ncbi:MAG: DUF3090 family protein [Chloroflexi bacterium]|nr:MAG: DUF3090 family protein [Chloroflexota bacterium]